MRPPLLLTILAAGAVAVTCLVFGVASGPACGTGEAAAACLGGSVSSIREFIGVAFAIGAIVGVSLAISTVWQVGRHRLLAHMLNRTARRMWIADHEVGLVAGLEAPCVAGLVHPRIYCPPDLTDRLSDRELRAVMLHERHHQVTHAPARLVMLSALAPALGCLESWPLLA